MTRAEAHFWGVPHYDVVDGISYPDIRGGSASPSDDDTERELFIDVVELDPDQQVLVGLEVMMSELAQERDPAAETFLRSVDCLKMYLIGLRESGTAFTGSTPEEIEAVHDLLAEANPSATPEQLTLIVSELIDYIIFIRTQPELDLPVAAEAA